MDDDMVRLRIAGQGVGYASVERYKARMGFVFDNVSLQGARVLDVGCGRGSISLWAALHGAKFVLSIDPESDGSRPGGLNELRRLISLLRLEASLYISHIRLEDLDIDENFDVVVLYDVVNHLDEHAVIHMDTDPLCYERYLVLARRLRNLSEQNGWLIMADCSRSNFWNTVGLTSPLARSIEWHKHQRPENWISLFRHAGFQVCDLRWSPLYPFGRWSSNSLVQYLTSSHFVLRLRAY